MNQKSIPISVVVPTKNEEINLDRCLSRLKRFEEVIVVDSSSSDQTVEIARHHGARVVTFVWNGCFPKKRNWLLSNHSLKCEWVLFLDADEILNESFCDVLCRTIHATKHSGFWLNYTNYFLGRPLRFGVAQRKLALFRVGAGLYERIEENAWSGLDMEIHEHPIINGSIGKIRERIDHNDDRGILKFIDRHRDYALWEANRIKMLRQGATSWASLTSRQKFKYRNLRRAWFPFFYFAFHYFVKLGFLDGYAGLQYALYKLWYFSTIYLLCRFPNERRPVANCTE